MGCGKGFVSFVTVSVIILAVLYKFNIDSLLNERLEAVLHGLLRAEKKVSAEVVERPKVGVGFGACLDAFLPASVAFSALGWTPSGVRKHFDSVHSAEDLEKLYNYFFYHGAAAERYVGNQTFFDELVASALVLEDTRWATGGNAPVMAKRLAMEGANVLLGARMSPNISFHSQVKALGLQNVDDVHIIYEYDRGDKWGDLISPRANRLIVHNDQFNPMLNMLAEFRKEMLIFKPALFVLGGLQMMDNYPFPPGVRAQRLEELEDFLKVIPHTTLIHFEMASYTEEALIQDLIDKVVPHADSLGVNEQELPNILAMMKGEHAKLVSDANPRVASMLDELRELFTLIDDRSSLASRKLTRIHVHTLAYQAVVTHKGSQWKNTMSSAAKASLVANRYVCGNASINLEKARLIIDESFSSSVTEGSPRIYVQDDRPVSCWEEGERLFCVAPNLVCTDVLQTGGGGDNISAAALFVQI